jgi:hypothetical protein
MRMRTCRQAGFTVLEMMVAAAVMMVAILLASRLLVESQIEMQRRLAELGNPQPRYAEARLRHDLEGAAVVPALLPDWRQGGLQLTLAQGGRVLWRERGGLLERVQLDAIGQEVVVQRLLGDMAGWRWRRPLPGLVDVHLRFRVAQVTGAQALGNRRGGWPGFREEELWLRVAQRVGGGG